MTSSISDHRTIREYEWCQYRTDCSGFGILMVVLHFFLMITADNNRSHVLDFEKQPIIMFFALHAIINIMIKGELS